MFADGFGDSCDQNAQLTKNIKHDVGKYKPKHLKIFISLCFCVKQIMSNDA